MKEAIKIPEGVEGLEISYKDDLNKLYYDKKIRIYKTINGKAVQTI